MKSNQTKQNNHQDRPNQSHQLFVPLTEEQQQQLFGGGRRPRTASRSWLWGNPYDGWS